MKKFFALVLAVAMVMSLSSVAMAAAVDHELTIKGAYDYDADNDRMRWNGIQYGDTVYFQLVEIDENNNEAALEKYEMVEKLKVKVEFEMGEELVESVDVVKMNVADTAVGTNENEAPDFVAPAGNYAYFIAVKTVKKAATVDADVVGTFELSRKAIKFDKDNVDDINKIDDVEEDFEFTLFYTKNWNDDDLYELVANEDEVKLEWDTDYVLKFKNDEEVELSFGTEPNEGTFTVDVSGQGKLYVRYNTTADEAIAAANPGVKMHFVNFNNVKFNRTGEFMYEMEDGVACYKVVDGALVEIPGAEYDEADEAFYFNTRVLGSYVFANAELVNPVVEAPVVAPEVTNPTTGA